jgi:hypothetical protein
MRDRKRCAGNSDRRNRPKNSVAHPDGETPPGQTRTRPFRKLSCRRSAANSTSGSGPTRSRERSPLLIWNSPEPASGVCVREGRSRPVDLAGGGAPPARSRKGPLRRPNRASESGPFRRSRKRPPTRPLRVAPAGRFPRPPLYVSRQSLG